MEISDRIHYERICLGSFVFFFGEIQISRGSEISGGDSFCSTRKSRLVENTNNHPDATLFRSKKTADAHMNSLQTLFGLAQIYNDNRNLKLYYIPVFHL